MKEALRRLGHVEQSGGEIERVAVEPGWVGKELFVQGII
jgi:hypothetical protein